jgi:LacI family transcriptional regulator
MINHGVRFTAVLAFDDLTALGVIRALHQAGRRVPDDCSVIGFDDVPLAALNTPALTTIRQPMEQMGCLAAEWVLASLNSQQAAGESSIPRGTLHLLPPELVVRESSRRKAR